jgi:hypothetical protein
MQQLHEQLVIRNQLRRKPNRAMDFHCPGASLPRTLGSPGLTTTSLGMEASP